MRWLFSLVILVVLALAFVLYWGGEDYLSRYLTTQLGARTSIRSLGIGTRSITLKGLEVFNPRGSKMTHAFEVRTLNLEAPLTNYFKKTLHFEELKLDSPKFGIEFYNSSGSANNWVQILKNLPHSSGGRPLVIDRLVITNIEFDVMKSNGKGIAIPSISYLEFKDLGKGRPLSTTELSRIIFQSILTVVAKEAAVSKILNNVVPLSKQVLRDAPIEEKTKGRIEKAEKILDQLLEKTHF